MSITIEEFASHASPVSDRDAVSSLLTGEIEIVGLFPNSSNHTFAVLTGEDKVAAVFKPGDGERRLWDFPPGLYKREVAAYLVSEYSGIKCVPPTFIRSHPELGEGSLQQFVDGVFEEHYFTIFESGSHNDELKKICALDLVCNNADRKSGHCILGRDGKIWAIDNGLSFHTEPKVRTVIWEFVGEPLPDSVRETFDELAAGPAALARTLDGLLSPTEIEAISHRAKSLLELGEFPSPLEDAYPYPWPLI